MRRIPYRLLDGSCTLRIYRREGVFGELCRIREYTISRVRISFGEKALSDTSGNMEVFSGCIYYDCRRSLPADAVLSLEGCVSTAVIKGVEYRITEIKYFYFEGAMHHIEIRLGGVR